MDLKLTSDEGELVKELLEERYRELLREIARAEHLEFKLDLRKKEQVLKAVLNKIGSAEPARKAG